jgi:hypothetical protein
LCAVQIFFTGGGRRDYLILYQSAAYCREGFWCAKSLADDLSMRKLDLRNQKDVGALSKTLQYIDLTLLRNAMS